MRKQTPLLACITVLLLLFAQACGQEAGDLWTEPVTGMEFVWVPGGCYEMGCGEWTGECRDNELPAHNVCVDGFWMGKYEVTQGQWQQVMGDNPSGFAFGDEYPVGAVSWEDAHNFISALESMDDGDSVYRLPTEAEWEYACRSGGRNERYSGGDEIDSVAWFRGNSDRRPHPAGTKSPNGLGLYDMSGNVEEWVQDWYDPTCYRRNGLINPLYARDDIGRVLRGGHNSMDANESRCSNRSRQAPDFRNSYIGVRIIRIELDP